MHEVTLPADLLAQLAERRGQLHVFDRLDPASTALLAIDMQNAFVHPDGFAYVETAAGIVPNINRLGIDPARCRRDRDLDPGLAQRFGAWRLAYVFRPLRAQSGTRQLACPAEPRASIARLLRRPRHPAGRLDRRQGSFQRIYPGPPRHWKTVCATRRSTRCS